MKNGFVPMIMYFSTCYTSQKLLTEHIHEYNGFLTVSAKHALLPVAFVASLFFMKEHFIVLFVH